MLSVVITSCHDDEGLYLTYWAARQQLGHERVEYVIVADGGTEWKYEKQPNTVCLRGTFGSPQASRDVGIKTCHHRNVFVLESHVIMSDVQRLAFEHERLSGAITFPIRVAEGPEQFTVYAHETNWDGDLWVKRARYEPVSDEPYRVGQFGNSCFVLDRDWYLETGGYENFLTGFGGEEPFICLKAWLTGREVWQVPSVLHAHYLSLKSGFPDVKRNLTLVRKRLEELGDLKKLRRHLESIGAVC